MSVSTVVAVVAAGLVVVAGVGKLVHPAATREQLLLPGGRQLPVTVVRALGLAEVVLAMAVLLRGGPLLLALLAVTYLGFLAVALRQRAAGRGCGCLGGGAPEVGVAHLLVDGTAAVFLALAARATLEGAAAPVASLPQGPAALVTVALLGVATSLASLLLTRLPELASLQREVRAGGRAT